MALIWLQKTGFRKPFMVMSGVDVRFALGQRSHLPQPVVNEGKETEEDGAAPRKC